MTAEDSNDLGVLTKPQLDQLVNELYPIRRAIRGPDKKIISKPAKCTLCENVLKWQKLGDRREHLENAHSEAFLGAQNARLDKLTCDNSKN